ncbi:MAG: CDP-glycerol glycerophosphotransferase family protein [Clostridia bacterium]|nr:CDP-glycerol glycerophosphotransferase family protein [Clostridia bacterium]
MQKKLISFVKYNKFVLSLYRFFGNMLVGLIALFTIIRKKRILFMSFGGQKYDDSPRVLYEKMKNDPFFKDYEFIWAFREPSKFQLDCNVVKADTFKFYKAALSSGMWITNSSVERGLKLRRKKIIEINSWHGTPLKKMGNDIQENHSFRNKNKKKGVRI